MKQFWHNLRRSLGKNAVLFPAVGIMAGIIGFIGVQPVLTQQKNSRSNTLCQDMCVALRKDGMVPNELAVKVGQFVQFNTADGEMHNISMGRGEDGAESHDHEAHDVFHEHIGDYASGDFGVGEAWRVQFKKTGTYHLHDHYHPKLQIVVVVYDPNTPHTIR